MGIEINEDETLIMFFMINHAPSGTSKQTFTRMCKL